MTPALHSWLADTQAWVDAVLEGVLPPKSATPGSLHDAMRYAVFGGGKRLRPAIVRLIAESFGCTDLRLAEPGAAAIELVHTYSLVHDDLPAMDDDDLRRGRATCHVVYGEALAILVGDALQTLAFEQLAHAPAGSVSALARAAGSRGMVGGQVLDIESDGRAETWREVLELQRLKTAAMLRAAAELGALAAGVQDVERFEAVGRFGELLGQTFQVVDDLLDVTASADVLGKTPGKDAALERGTSVAVLGLAGAREAAESFADGARQAARKLGWGPGSRADDLIAFTLERAF